MTTLKFWHSSVIFVEKPTTLTQPNLTKPNLIVVLMYITPTLLGDDLSNGFENYFNLSQPNLT